MKNIIALAGSNSKKSINKQLVVSVAKSIENTKLNVIDLNDINVPMYGIDEENLNGIPNEIINLNEKFASADGFVISLAEHNGSYSTAFKNILDWLSRVDQKIWKNKPMLLMSTSPGERGGATVLGSASATFPYLGGNIVAEFSLPSFFGNFSDGEISNDDFKKDISEKVLLFQNTIK